MRASVYLLPGLLPLLYMMAATASAQADLSERHPVSSFHGNGIKGWEDKSFVGHTRYKIVSLGGESILQAESAGSASGLYKKQRIDLTKTPYLNWRWRIDNRINSGDETTKSGDDYAARIYLVIAGGWQFWNTRAISYVWANQQQAGAIWDNAFAGKSVKMIALRSAGDSTKTWYTEKRNVYKDLKQVFGEEIKIIDAVAIMTDTDNSDSKATSYYADIFFSAE